MSSSKQAKRQESSASLPKRSDAGEMKVKSTTFEEEESSLSDDTTSASLSMRKSSNPNQGVETLSTPESPQEAKKKTWSDKLRTSKSSTLITKLLGTLEAVLTSSAEDFKPYWTQHSKELSDKLWLPSKTDSVASALSSSSKSSRKEEAPSWFSNTKTHLRRKNSRKTSSPSLPYSQPAPKDLENTRSSSYKTVKILLKPSPEERRALHTLFEQQRWYYNCALNILYRKGNLEKVRRGNKVSRISMRNLVRKYEYVETEEDGKIIKRLIYDENRNAVPDSGKWGVVHNRVPRGATDKLVSALNSAISNNNLKYKLKPMKKKATKQTVHFEDASYPAWLNKIEGQYKASRTNFTLQEVLSTTSIKSISITYCKEEQRYYFNLPVEYTWSLREGNDESQAIPSTRSPFVSLDPGVRTFLTGYSSDHTFDICTESKRLSSLLIEADSLFEREKEKQSTKKKKRIRKRKLKCYSKCRNLVDELHFKTCSYLTKNYDVIVLADFRITQMVRKKTSKLPRIVKRLMYMFSFYRFKERLLWNAKMNGCDVHIVNESYTSMTCSACGFLNRELGKSKTFECPCCGIEIDRDINGARGILIKNWPSLQGH